jgi:hypothetical protein
VRKPILLVTLLVLVSGFISNTDPPAASAAPGVVPPTKFIENLGQLESGVKFHLKTPQGNAYYLADSLIYQVITDDSVHNIRLRFEDSSPDAIIEGVGGKTARMNYFIGSDRGGWVSGARSYGGLVYRNLYPAVDLLVGREGGHLKHEYRILPGGHADRITVRYEGAEKLMVNAAGELEIWAAGKVIFKEAAPVSYQIIGGRRHEVESSYTLQDGNILGFEVGPYQKNRDLIIDPSLVFSTYLGGEGYDSASDIAVDLDRNVYVVGSTYALDFPSDTEIIEPAWENSQVFLTKLDPTGSRILWSTVLGGWDNDSGAGIAISWPDESVVICGSTVSYDFPTTRGAYDTTHNGGADVFLAKFDFSGKLVFSSCLGAPDREFSPDIGVDGAGNIYVAGQTDSEQFPTTPGAYDRVFDKHPLANTYPTISPENIFVAKFDPLGSELLYSTFYGKYSLDLGGIAVDFDGNAYIAGGMRFPGETIPVTPGAYWTEYYWIDGFLGKIDPTGSRLIYSTLLGYELIEPDIYLDGIAVDGKGRAALTGAIRLEGSYASRICSFLMAIAPGGNRVLFQRNVWLSDEDWEKYIWGRDLAFDGRGGLYTVYNTANPDLFTTADAVQSDLRGGSDLYLEKMKALTGEVIYATYLGGNDSDGAGGMTVDSFGSAYVVGSTRSVDFPTTPSVLSPTPIGQGDAFVVRIRDGGPLAKLETNKDELRFQSPYQSTATKTKRVTIKNDGEGVAAYTISANQSWLGLSRKSGKVRFDIDGLQATVDPSGLKSGVHWGTVKIASADAFNSPLQIPVRYKIKGPALKLSMTAFLFEAAEGGPNPPPQECRVRNRHQSSKLTYHITSLTPWLSTSRNKGVSHGEWDKFKIKVDISGLEAGIHQGTIQVSADETIGGPEEITVILNLKSEE